MQGIRNIRCQSCGCDYFKTKGKNVRFFWYIVGAVVGVLLLLFMLGSAMGCDLCIECAEACDMDELADCGRDCDEETDACVAANCQGTTCGEKQGFGRCEEKWDCSSCGGYIEYTVTIVLDEYNETSFTVDQREQSISEIEYIQPQYIPGQGPTYYEFLGYYSKNFKTMYVDSEGNVVRKLKGSTTLYARYEEKALGEEYTLVFNTEKEDGGYWFDTPANIPVIVGDIVNDMPEAPYLDGFTFLGWYNDDGEMVVSPNQDSWEFHLYLMNHDPNNDFTSVQLHAKYDLNKHRVTFHYDDGSTDVREVYYDTNLNEFVYEMDRSNGNTNYMFFGWSTDANAEPVDKMDYNLPITEDIDLYEIRKDYITLTFHINARISDDYGGFIDLYSLTYTTYEDQAVEFAYLELDSQYNLIYDPNNQVECRKLIDSLNSDDAKPGFEFNSWAINSANGINAGSSVTVGKKNPKEFYTKWKEKTYSIMYMSEDEVDITSYAQALGALTTYNYGSSGMLWDYGTWIQNSNFLGWRIKGKDAEGTYHRYLSGDLYGDLILIPEFNN